MKYTVEYNSVFGKTEYKARNWQDALEMLAFCKGENEMYKKKGLPAEFSDAHVYAYFSDGYRVTMR